MELKFCFPSGQYPSLIQDERNRGTNVTIHQFLTAAVAASKTGPPDRSIRAATGGRHLKTISVTLEKSKETKGTYRFDSSDPNAPITSIYVRKSAFSDGTVPKRIVLTVDEQE